jgi:hypothetical protein
MPGAPIAGARQGEQALRLIERLTLIEARRRGSRASSTSGAGRGSPCASDTDDVVGIDFSPASIAYARERAIIIL